MSSFVKKSLLTAVFASVAILAGCSNDNRPKTDPAFHASTKAELLTKAAAAADAAGETIRLKGDDGCVPVTGESAARGYEDSCTFHVEKKIDDGFIRAASYRPKTNMLSLGQCELRENDPLADKISRAADAAFDADAKKKFAKMKFTVLDTFKEPESYLNQTDEACFQQTSAEFLLKSGVTGKLYTATFSEGYDFSAKAGYGAEVSALKEVDRAGKAKADDDASNDEAADETPAAAPVASSSSSSSTTPAPKPPESKLCVGVCSGPHIDLATGKLKVFGTGPGLKIP